MVLLCSFGFSVLCLSASWLHWALFSGHLFFGAGNSERCLSQFLCKCEVRAAGSIRNLILVLWSWIAEIRSMFFKTMSCFGFLRFGFCL
ncbi:hypothetical protein CEG15_16650 [Vibrio anguillarum]|nr:hypothetical protein CEG15_16650 [Vibrio anguillarum]